MFGLWKRRKPLVHAQWYVPLLDKHSDAEEFYKTVEEEIKRREFPGVFVERLKLREGGLLSWNREYLRLSMDRAVLDICSAEFGTCWYFSCRAATILWTMRWWEFFVILLTLGNFILLYPLLFGLLVGPIALAGTVVAPILLCLLAGNWPGLDAYLLRVPVLGSIYESFFRRITYYRLDTLRMFMDIANSIVREQTKRFCEAMGEPEPHFIDVSHPEQVQGLRELWAERMKEMLAEPGDHP
jgi:hypothetical protein